MKRCAILANGSVSDYAWLAEMLAGYSAVFAADGGFHHCEKAGVAPGVVLGDMDSIASDPGVPTVRFPAVKDSSDLELAVEHALSEGHDEIDIFGALGGRIDHELCNLMVCAKHPGAVRIIDESSTIIALGRGCRVEMPGSPGDIVTLAAIEPGTRCSTHGLRYRLDDEILDRGSRGLSNVMAGESFSVSVSGGLLLVIHLRGG